MTKGRTSYESSRNRTVDVESGTSISIMTKFDKCLNKCLNKCCIIATLIVGFLIFLLLIGTLIGVLIAFYEIDKKEDCKFVNIMNSTFVTDSYFLDITCFDKYNITKIMTIGNNNNKFADCVFDVVKDQEQLLLNKFNETFSILDNWISNNETIIIIGDYSVSHTILFAYMLDIGYAFNDILKEFPILGSEIIYNFYQQLAVYNNGYNIDEIENILWKKTSNNLTCF